MNLDLDNYPSMKAGQVYMRNSRVATHDAHIGNIGCPDHTLTVSHHTPLRRRMGLMDYGDAVALRGGNSKCEGSIGDYIDLFEDRSVMRQIGQIEQLNCEPLTD